MFSSGWCGLSSLPQSFRALDLLSHESARRKVECVLVIAHEDGEEGIISAILTISAADVGVFGLK